jgi:multidrug resistance efflux pump
MKKATMIMLALLVCALPAFAESGAFAGEVVAAKEVSVSAPCDGTVGYAVRAGERIGEGDLVATYETEKVYATGDGTVAAVWAAEGEEISGTLIEIEPIEKYTVYCAISGAYESVDTCFVQPGETVYIKCTADGTHRGTGTITSVDGEEYMVATTGGEFYVGETVYLYRDADFTYSQRIGIGTLIYADNVQYEADGTVIRLYIQASERVERGQLLYETLSADAVEVTAPASGIVLSVGGATESEAEASDAADSLAGAEDISETATAAKTDSDAAQSSEAATAAQGGSSDEQASETTSAADNAVSEGDALAVICPTDSIMVEIAIPEDSLGAISAGQAAEVVFADEPNAVYTGVVARISNIAEEDGSYLALISVKREGLSIGMSCDVMIR